VQPPPGVVETGSNVSRNGCTVDLKRICRGLFDQPEFTIQWRQIRHPSPGAERLRTVDLLANYNYRHGELLAAVNCQLDMSTHAVPEADLANGPPNDDKAAAYVGSQGLCVEDTKK